MRSLTVTPASNGEIERRMLSVIDYLRTRVAPDDLLLQALLAQKSELCATEDPGVADEGDLWDMAERCGLVDARTHPAPRAR